MGFCVFGNVAIAARYAQRVHGLKRVFIIDFNVHHGNGRCVFSLEGGYNLKSLSYSMADSFRAFLEEPSIASEFDDLAILYQEPSAKVKQAIQRIKPLHTL
ncbi:hypothetical protein QYF36_019830 [Acer negundo]|nr:hypothetical protein QYF36_019830 [Acer negundo]